MKTINLIFGASGFAREVDWLIYEIFEKDHNIDYRPHFFVVHKDDPKVGTIMNNIPILSEEDAINKFANSSEFIVNAFISVGSPTLKEKIVKNIIVNQNFRFPTIIHPNVSYDKRSGKIIVGQGVIICSNNVLTTDIAIASFAHINISCTVGHNSKIGSFSTVSPGVNISGNVQLSENTFLGSNTTILENVSIARNIIVGAGAVVTKNLTESGTYVGIPAIKK